ncbi:MAG: phosphate-starvation-inducible PsiE family protein [Methanoregula sp.]|jgi:uncharacterized membrane protein (DUF373 family)|uniref:phosphate-starvation-inducible PsiE family protein n=1 Tax=Methanoregula sp. TaxID=2052170 RepID=UPI003C782326
MPENPPAANTPVNQPGLEYIIKFFALVPMALYMIVAALLTIIAVFSVFDAVKMIFNMILDHDVADGITLVINSLLLTITIIVLFETVTVYFRTKHVEVRALLIAGLTGMVRHILIFNVSTTNDVYMMFAAVALLAVLIAGIVLVKSEVTASPV